MQVNVDELLLSLARSTQPWRKTLARVSVHKVENPTVIDGLIITAFHMLMSFAQLLQCAVRKRLSCRRVYMYIVNVHVVLLAGSTMVVNVYRRRLRKLF